MANNIIKRVWNQNRMVNIEDLCGMAFQAEAGGHTFQIFGVDDTGAAVPLSGTVAGVFRRPDNADIALTGASTGGVASVTLTEDCYAVPGFFGLTIFVTSGGQKTAVYAAVGTVAVTSGGAVAGDTPQDVVDLINAIEAAVATIPASYTDLMTSIAPIYSTTALYPVGSYVWYDGHLYRCTTPITTAETWTAAHWTAAVLGDDIKNIVTGINGVDLYNMLPLYGSFADSTLNGVTWKWNKEHTKCTVNGQASAASYNNFLVSLYDLLCFKAGETYRFNVKSSAPASLSMHVFFVYNGTIDTQNALYLIRPIDVTIPSSATGIVIRVGCAGGVTFSNATIEVGVDNRLIPTLYPSGSTNNRGTEILTRISKFGYCELAAGDFYLDAPVTMPANCSLIGTSKNSRIIKSSHENLGMFIVNGTTQNVTFRDITFVGTNTNRPDSEVTVGEIAISLFGYAGYVTVDNCAFYGLERAGIYTESGYDWVRCLDVSNCNFLFCGKGIEFAIHGEFSRVSNSHFNACYYGVVNQGGNNCFSCCGFDGCYTGMLLYDSAQTPTNDGHGSCVASTFNHCDSYCIVATYIDNGYVFDACEIFFGGVYISNSTGIRFSNCQLRGESETPINVTNSTLVVVDDCIFARSPAVFNVSNTSRFIKRNCYYLDGTDVE